VINVLSSILTDLFSLPMMTPLTAFSALNIYGEQMSDSQHDWMCSCQDGNLNAWNSVRILL